MIYRNSHPEVFCKKGVLRNLPNSLENNCARLSFFIKLQAFTSLRPVTLFLNKETLAQLFPCEIYENTFFHRTPLVAASGYNGLELEKYLNYLTGLGLILWYIMELDLKSIQDYLIGFELITWYIGLGLEKHLG